MTGKLSLALAALLLFAAGCGKSSGAADSENGTAPVSHETRAVLKTEEAHAVAASETNIYPTEEEKELLTLLVAAEAGEMPYMAQVGLAALVLNRTAEPPFPDTIGEVIYNSLELSAAVEAAQLEQPHEKSLSTARSAVEEALSGKDPTGGALYYCLREEVVEKYVVPTYQCGGMVFGR